MGGNLWERTSAEDLSWSLINGSCCVKDVVFLKVLGIGVIVGVGLDNYLYAKVSFADQYWQRIPDSGLVTRIELLPDNTLLGIGLDNMLYHRLSLYGQWRQIPNSGYVKDVAVRSDGSIVGVGMAGNLWERRSPGSPWSRIDGSSGVIGVGELADGRMIGVDTNYGLWLSEGSLPSRHENSGTFANVEQQIRALGTTPVEGTIDGTYSTTHLFDTYSAGVQHVQGIAWLPDGGFALSHDSRTDRRALFVAQTSPEDTVMLNVGSGGYHPGAIQAAGKVVAIPIKGGSDGNEVIFMDLRDKENPKELSHLRIVGQSGAEALGFAYDPKRKVHWIITTAGAYGHGSTVSSTLYKSNGLSLFDPNCRFERVNEFPSLFASQGGTQILFDDLGKMYVAALYRVEPGEDTTGLVSTTYGYEHVALSLIENLDSESPTSRVLLDKRLSDSGEWYDYGAGFRWGGTISKGPDGKLQAVAVSRTLAYGPAQQYAKTKTWRQP